MSCDRSTSRSFLGWLERALQPKTPKPWDIKSCSCITWICYDQICNYQNHLRVWNVVEEEFYKDQGVVDPPLLSLPQQVHLDGEQKLNCFCIRWCQITKIIIKFVLVVIYVQVGSNWIYCLQYCIGGSRSQGNLWSDLSGGSDSHVSWFCYPKDSLKLVVLLLQMASYCCLHSYCFDDCYCCGCCELLLWSDMVVCYCWDSWNESCIFAKISLFDQKYGKNQLQNDRKWSLAASQEYYLNYG